MNLWSRKVGAEWMYLITSWFHSKYLNGLCCSDHLFLLFLLSESHCISACSGHSLFPPLSCWLHVSVKSFSTTNSSVIPMFTSRKSKILFFFALVLFLHHSFYSKILASLSCKRHFFPVLVLFFKYCLSFTKEPKLTHIQELLFSPSILYWPDPSFCFSLIFL